MRRIAIVLIRALPPLMPKIFHFHQHRRSPRHRWIASIAHRPFRDKHRANASLTFFLPLAQWKRHRPRGLCNCESSSFEFSNHCSQRRLRHRQRLNRRLRSYHSNTHRWHIRRVHATSYLRMSPFRWANPRGVALSNKAPQSSKRR